VESNLVLNVLLPSAVAFIMAGLGMSLTSADFARVLAMPRAVLLGLFVQTILLTGVCFALVVALALPPTLAVGMMLIAAAPGGASANIFSHVARGDVALNITLTAINSVVSLVTLPLIVSFSLWYFTDSVREVPAPFAKVAEVSMLVVVPVVIGMLIRWRWSMFALRAESWVRLISVLALALFSAVALARSTDVLMQHLVTVGVACVLFNILSVLCGYFLPRFAGLGKAQAIAISMEIAIHNAALAMFVALHVLGDGAYAIPAALYSFVMFVSASLFTLWVIREPRPTVWD
jgi:bile acid:Na+ symporter, BASS family